MKSQGRFYVDSTVYFLVVTKIQGNEQFYIIYFIFVV